MSNAEHTQSPASPVPTPAHPRQGAGRTNDITETRTTAPSTRSGHIGLIVVGSLATGLTAALMLVLVVFAGAAEPVVTGSAMLAFGLGWAMLAALSVWRTDQPQRWALVPAAYFAIMGAALLLFSPGDGALSLLGWAWPPLLLALLVWTVVHARRHLRSRTRPLVLYPVLLALTLSAAGGALETVAESAGGGQAVAGRMVDVDGHRLYLACSGTGSPTVVLENGLGEHTPSWAWIVKNVARDTRVCVYDRAGQGWSESAAGPQDGVQVAADLHTLLERAAVPGPYVLAGHSVGGTYALTFAARYPQQVAGMVLLDSSTPQQFTALPGYPAAWSSYRRLSALLPPLARVGLLRLVAAGGFDGLPPQARSQELALAVTARELSSQRAEWSELPAAFTQAQTLTDLNGKPLIVVTAGLGQQAGWPAAQHQLARLSSNSLQGTVAGADHTALLDNEAMSADSSQAIRDVVSAVRTGTPLEA
jgi:pimeloyl-ACP methyl ester carboxylesterase